MAISIAYEPTFRDYLFLNRWTIRRRWLLLRYLSLALLALFLASPFLFHDLGAEGFLPSYGRSLFVFVLSAVVFAVIPANLYVAARKRWKAAPEIREPRRFTFSDDGIVVEGQTFGGRAAWSHIVGAGSYRGLIILKTNQGLYYLFPERAFPDEDQREAFLSLVRKKVSPTFGRRSVLGQVKFLEPSRNVDRVV